MLLSQQPLADGREITVYMMIFTFRLCVGPAGEPVYDDAWCYNELGQAMMAALEWDGDGDPPGRWIKQVGTERRREWDDNGHLVREYVAER